MDDSSFEESLDTVEFALINLVKGYPELYNAHDPNSRDKRKKDLAWTNIASQLNRDEGWCYAKWKNLTDYYKKRRKIYERGSSSGGTGRRWVYYDALSFLDFYESHREEAGIAFVGHPSGEISRSSTDCEQIFLDDTQYHSLDGVSERAQDFYQSKRRRVTADASQNLPGSSQGNQQLHIVQNYSSVSNNVESNLEEDPIHIPCSLGEPSKRSNLTITNKTNCTTTSSSTRTKYLQNANSSSESLINCPHYHFCQSLLVRFKNMNPANAIYTQMKIMELLLKTEFPKDYEERAKES